MTLGVETIRTRRLLLFAAGACCSVFCRWRPSTFKKRRRVRRSMKPGSLLPGGREPDSSAALARLLSSSSVSEAGRVVIQWCPRPTKAEGRRRAPITTVTPGRTALTLLTAVATGRSSSKPTRLHQQGYPARRAGSGLVARRAGAAARRHPGWPRFLWRRRGYEWAPFPLHPRSATDERGDRPSTATAPDPWPYFSSLHRGDAAPAPPQTLFSALLPDPEAQSATRTPRVDDAYVQADEERDVDPTINLLSRHNGGRSSTSRVLSAVRDDP